MRMVCFALVLILFACGGPDRPPSPPRDAGPITTTDAAVDGGEDAGFPGLAPTFAAIYTERLSQPMYCGGAGCHDSSRSGGMDFTLDQEAVRQTLLGATLNATGAQTHPSRVEPGDPESSFLIVKLSRDDAPDGRMPLGQLPLLECEIGAVRSWIAGGAE